MQDNLNNPHNKSSKTFLTIMRDRFRRSKSMPLELFQLSVKKWRELMNNRPQPGEIWLVPSERRKYCHD